jgi:hypothetical protein
MSAETAQLHLPARASGQTYTAHVSDLSKFFLACFKLCACFSRQLSLNSRNIVQNEPLK